jgi:formylglycine-generating enzyme required for sulfatase activity
LRGLVVALSTGLLAAANVVQAAEVAWPVPQRVPGEPPLVVSRSPVSHRQWLQCVRQGGCGAYRPERQGWPLDSPVVNVSLDDAETYARWLSRHRRQRWRLPYEDEWSRIVPAPPARGEANCLDCGSRWDGRGLHRSGALPANAAGLFDAAGNAAQWLVPRPGQVSRCKGSPYQGALGGASWADPAKYLDPAEISCLPRVLRDDTIGFRLVREPDASR